MDAHLYWNHCLPTESFVSPLVPFTPFHPPIPIYPVYAAPPAPHDPLTSQVQQPTPQPLRGTRVPDPERFLGASCQWVLCNSSKRTPMLAYGFSPILCCPRWSHLAWIDESASWTAKAEP
jgi:hypothetical protein